MIKEKGGCVISLQLMRNVGLREHRMPLLFSSVQALSSLNWMAVTQVNKSRI